MVLALFGLDVTAVQAALLRMAGGVAVGKNRILGQFVGILRRHAAAAVALALVLLTGADFLPACAMGSSFEWLGPWNKPGGIMFPATEMAG